MQFTYVFGMPFFDTTTDPVFNRPNITYWSPASIYLEYVSRLAPCARVGSELNLALLFQQNATTAWYLSGENVTLQGTGGIDGSGQVWWNAFANLCVFAPTARKSRHLTRPSFLGRTRADLVLQEAAPASLLDPFLWPLLVPRMFLSTVSRSPTLLSGIRSFSSLATSPSRTSSSRVLARTRARQLPTPMAVSDYLDL